MEIINRFRGATISTWESAAALNPLIELLEMKLHKGLVCGAIGIVTIDGKKLRMKWFHDGRCFHAGKRHSQYDIKL